MGDYFDFRLWLRLVFGNLSVATSGCLSAGGAAALAALWLDKSAMVSFVYGSLLPLFPIIVYNASTWRLMKNLAAWQDGHAKGLITALQLSQYRQAAITWHRERWFGTSRLADIPAGVLDETDSPVSAGSRPSGTATTS